MEAEKIGALYDKVAQWWNEQHQDSAYGMAQIERAIRYCKHHRRALDVGCGSGGRVIHALLERGFQVRGVDVSKQMLENDGILIYTFGNDTGDHESLSFQDDDGNQIGELDNDLFGYGTIGVNENLRILRECGCQCCHLEIDQYPAKHVYIIARKVD